MERTIRVIEQVHSFRGTYPEVPIYAHVDQERLYIDDDKPFHLTLRLVQLGQRSSNDHLYDETLMHRLVKILPRRGERIVGHHENSQELWVMIYIPKGPQREKMRTLLRKGGTLVTGIILEDNAPTGLGMCMQGGDS